MFLDKLVYHIKAVEVVTFYKTDAQLMLSNCSHVDHCVFVAQFYPDEAAAVFGLFSCVLKFDIVFSC